MMHRRSAIILFVLLTGCAAQTLQAASRETFAQETTCPPERVSVVARPDIAKPPAPEPPNDVAADPGRLAYWRKQHAAELSEAANAEVFELAGCGQKRITSCTWSTTWVGENPVNYATCTPIKE